MLVLQGKVGTVIEIEGLEITFVRNRLSKQAIAVRRVNGDSKPLDYRYAKKNPPLTPRKGPA
jgi:hypothetical protein